MSTAATLLAGSAGLRTALGDYRLVAEVARGGMGSVFLALLSSADGTSRPVVLKQLQSELASEPDFRAMFENEALLASRFHHPNVVETYDIIADRDICVLVMEFLDGQPLSRVRQRAKQGSQVPSSIHLQVLADALAGLHYVHELADADGTPFGIVHRDVTPSNVFVTYDGRVKVVDFGIAKATMRPGETRVGVLKGKLAYMSPEAVRNKRVDRRSDIFSVGVMLWEAATGRRLWCGQDEMAIFQGLVAGDVPIQASSAPGASAEMLRIATRALAVDPSDRYATAEEMRLELQSLMGGLGQTTQHPALAEHMETSFALERAKFQKMLDEALASSSHSQPFVDSQPLGTEATASSLDIDTAEPPTTISSMPTNEGTFRTATTAYDVVATASETPDFRRRRLSGFGAAIVAMAAAVGVAYAANAPVGAPAPRASITSENNTILDEAPRENALAAEPLAPPQAPPVTSAIQPAPSEILAVFVARPAHARLFLDGVPLEANPATIRRQPDDKHHVLRVEAAGYAPLVRTIELSRDIAKELELAPEGTRPVDAPAKRAPRREDPWGI